MRNHVAEHRKDQGAGGDKLAPAVVNAGDRIKLLLFSDPDHPGTTRLMLTRIELTA